MNWGASFDLLDQDSGSRCRRQSDNMLPPSSRPSKGIRSESSTPKCYDASTSALTTNFLKDSQPSFTCDFAGFRQSIISASSVHKKLEELTEAVNESENEIRRKQKYASAYEPSFEFPKIRYEASRKAKARWSQHFESLTADQTSMAQRLEAQIAENSAKKVIQSTIADKGRGEEELAKLRKELQTELREMERKSLKQVDLDVYESKFAHREDLAGLVSETRLHQLEEKVAAQDLDGKRRDEKLANSMGLTNKCQADVHESRQYHDTHLQSVDRKLKTLQESHDQLEKSLQAQGRKFVFREAEITKLQHNLISLEGALHGNPDANEKGLIDALETHSQSLTETTRATEQLSQKVNRIKDETIKEMQDYLADSSRHQPCEEVAILRQDLEDLTEVQKREYTLLADTMSGLEDSLKELHNLSSRPPDTSKIDDLANSMEVDRIKLEKIESELKALITQFLVLKTHSDNLTTERLAHSISHQMQHLYKEHPGHVQDKIIKLESQLLRIEARLKCAAIDGIPELKNQVENIELSIKQCGENCHQTREDVSVHTNAIKRVTASQEDAIDGIRQANSLAHENTAKTIDRLQRDFQLLRHDIELDTAATISAHSSVGSSTLNQIPVAQPKWKGEIHSKGMADKNSKADKAILAQQKEAGMTCEQRENMVCKSNRARSTSTSESETPLASKTRPHQVKRKRKSMPRISDSEDDRDSCTPRKKKDRKET